MKNKRQFNNDTINKSWKGKQWKTFNRDYKVDIK